jgi:serine/threonine-protein kinase
MDGFLGGTPAYVAPEMVESSEVDGRADLYAVGCIAFWLLTGRVVFPRDNAMAAMMAHVRDTPEPPSQLTELAVPPELERIILACLEKEPERRPQSAVALAQRLAEVKLESPWTPERAEQWWAKHRPRQYDSVL